MPASCESEPAWNTVLDTPFGPLRLAGTAQGLTIVGFTEGERPARPGTGRQEDSGLLAEAARQLQEYSRDGVGVSRCR